MTYTVNSTDIFEVNFAPSSVVEEVLQNVYMIISTVKGTVPLDRNFGITSRNIDRPFPAATALLQTALYEAVEEYEPRADIENIDFDYEHKSGNIAIKIEVNIHE